jgi:diacylglycerol kinase (ATP)
VPSGTANDFARRTGLPDDPLAACRLAVGGRALRSLDLGRMGDRPFVNVATAGLSVAAARGARPLKGALGPAAYLAGAVRSAVVGRPLDCAVACDGRTIHAGPAWQVMVACSGAFGAGSRIAEADPADGMLDVVVLEAGPRVRLVRHAGALRRGLITDQPGVRSGRGRRVRLDLPAGAELNIDGEVEPAGRDFGVEPGHFRLVVG